MTATPSGVPQNEPQSVVVLRLPNSISYTEEDNVPEPRRTSHDLAHSTGLLKSSGYNLEWPRVTPIQVTLVIRDGNRAGRGRVSLSHTHPCRKNSSPSLYPNPGY